MSHEIRTPMNAVIGFSRLLKNEGISKQDFEDYLELINTSANSLLNLIDDILDLSLIQSNQLVMHEKDFGFNLLLDNIGAIYRLKFEDSMVDFTLVNSFNNEQLIVNSDKFRINQIVTNLLDNAYKFTDFGSVALTIERTDQNLILFVKDTGIGIANLKLKYIFDRFTKVEDNAKELYRGAGLGLAISKKLANNLGLKLAVESQLGNGSLFSLHIPLSKVVIA